MRISRNKDSIGKKRFMAMDDSALLGGGLKQILISAA